MSFYGDSFIFNGVPCEEFGMMLYDVGTGNSPTQFASNSKFFEDRIARRYDPLFYGSTQNDQLTFTMTFGLNPDFVNDDRYFDRYDFQKIASWLTGINGYRKLIILEPGLEDKYYNVRISDLATVVAGCYPQVFTCKVTCDSPFAYMTEKEFVFENADGDEMTVNVFNSGSYNGYYYPKMMIELNGSDSVSFCNTSDHDRTMSFANIPSGYSNETLLIDNLNQIILADDNFYPFSNKKFLRLVRGDNKIKITGKCTVKFVCSFPVNVGG